MLAGSVSLWLCGARHEDIAALPWYWKMLVGLITVVFGVVFLVIFWRAIENFWWIPFFCIFIGGGVFLWGCWGLIQAIWGLFAATWSGRDGVG